MTEPFVASKTHAQTAYKSLSFTREHERLQPEALASVQSSWWYVCMKEKFLKWDAVYENGDIFDCPALFCQLQYL